MSNELGTEVFHLVSSLIPIINVDLLIRNEFDHILLSWRDDEYAGKGWHVPGGVVRHKESLEERIINTSIEEIGVVVDYNMEIISVQEIIDYTKNIRSHFISLLFDCFLQSNVKIKNINGKGQLTWFDSCPNNLLKYHECYRRYI